MAATDNDVNKNGFAIVHVIADLRPQSGGTSRVAVDLVDALSKHEIYRLILISQSLTGTPVLPSMNSDIQRHVAESNARLALRLGLPLRTALRTVVEDGRACLIHNHGLWLPVNYWAAQVARRHRIHLVMQPHGMLEPWSINHRAWKKRIVLALFQRHDLEIAKVLVATSEEEGENIRRLGFRRPLAIIPNGVEVYTPEGANGHSDLGALDNRTVLFLSRIHPKKGLENLIRAWPQIASLDWRLRIAGPDEGGHLQSILDLVRELGVGETVEYIGSVEGDRKTAVYRDSDLFVLPTFSENFGVVIAEALAHGLPVITTRGAPWADLETFRCGWWIDIGVEPLVEALRQAMSLSDDERRLMGIRGREYVKRYDWDNIAQKTIDVYRWVLGQGPKPECVRTD